jgi:phage terminase large subunit-like protein
MPTQKKQPTLEELLNEATGLLEQSIIAPSILNFGGKPYPEQDRFFASDKDGRFISGGNRGGKTDAAVVDAIWTATNTHPHRHRPARWGQGAVQLRFVTVDIAKGVEQILLPKFKRWLAPSMLIDERWDKSWDGKNLILTLANGSSIDFVTWGMDMMKLGGVPRHGIYFDEEPPRHIFNESLFRLLDYRGYWVIAATPTKGMGWTYDLIWEPANTPGHYLEDKIATFTLSAEANPYNQATSDDMDFYSLGMDEEERKIRRSGEFVARSGLVFPSINQDPAKYIAEPRIPPRNWSWYSSVDHGLNNPTAWLWHAVSPAGGIITFAEHYQSEMVVAEHAAIVKGRELAFGREPDVRVGDPALKQRSGITGTNIIQEYGRHGINIGVEGIPRDVLPGIEKMQAYFRIREDSPWGPGRPTWVISANCVNFLRELKKLRWATYDSEERAYELNRQEVVHKKDDHAFDSARYFSTLMPDLYVPVEKPTESTPETLDYAQFLSTLSESSVTVELETATPGEWSSREIYEAPNIWGAA